jgi:hypothetical protein
VGYSLASSCSDRTPSSERQRQAGAGVVLGDDHAMARPAVFRDEVPHPVDDRGPVGSLAIRKTDVERDRTGILAHVE